MADRFSGSIARPKPCLARCIGHERERWAAANSSQHKSRQLRDFEGKIPLWMRRLRMHTYHEDSRI